MSTVRIFGLIVRVIGLGALISAVMNLTFASISLLPRTGSHLSYFVPYFIYGIISLALAIYFLGFPQRIIRISYPNEKE